MNIIFDGNYLFHKTFAIYSKYYKGQDLAEVLQQEKHQQILMRKLVMDMCYSINKFEDVEKVLFVFDSSSWRYFLYDDYKYSLTKVRDPYYKHFLECLNMFEGLLRSKGIIVSRVNGAEGDDLLYVWSIYFDKVLDEKLVIITGDSDMRQIITNNISLFNNNSKMLTIFCTEENEVYWNETVDTDIQVQAVVPFEVLLFKVIMGDTSDNIPKLKRGFGPKAFEKFLEHIKPYKKPSDISLVQLAQWISSRFAPFAKVNEEKVLGDILFNLKMTWLNLSVYNSTDYKTASGHSLLENMLDDVNAQKDRFSYKGEYTLESFYGMLIK